MKATRCRSLPACRRSRPRPSPRPSSPSGTTSSSAARLAARRDAPRPRRLLGHRHHRDPARQGFRRPRHRHRRHGGKMRGLPQARRRRRRQLQDRRLRRRDQEGDRRPRRRCHPRHGRRRAISNAITRQPPSKAASCKSLSRAPRMPTSISGASCSSGSLIPARRCAPAPIADKAAIARAVEDQGAPADRGRPGQAGDRLDLPAARSRRRPRPHGDEPAHRQDRPDPLKRQRNILAPASGSGYSWLAGCCVDARGSTGTG